MTEKEIDRIEASIEMLRHGIRMFRLPPDFNPLSFALGGSPISAGDKTNFRGAVSCLLLLTGSLVIGRPMMSMIAEHADEVRVRRYGDVPECDVVVAVRGLEMSLRCRDYNQAVKWARIECKSYKIAGGFTIER